MKKFFTELSQAAFGLFVFAANLAMLVIMVSGPAVERLILLPTS